jgi:hypothetical protein
MSNLQPAGRFNHFKPQAERSGDLTLVASEKRLQQAPALWYVIPIRAGNRVGCHRFADGPTIDLQARKSFVRLESEQFHWRTIGCEDRSIGVPSLPIFSKGKLRASTENQWRGFLV